MTQPRITIIGLGLIGGSIGLALKASGKAIHIIGHDIDPGRNKLAQKKGAVDKGTMFLLDACQDADLIIIATPITAIRETLEVIGPHLKQGCVVTDTATLKEPVLAWAAEALPPGVPFVGGDPVLNPAARPGEASFWDTGLMAPAGLEAARADLLQGALYALCAPVGAAPGAVKRVTDMINLIQARPLYIDPVEHDGIRAAVEGLPALISLALMQMVAESPGWREGRKLADHIFGMVTVPLADEAASQCAQVLLNTDHLLPRLDALVNELVRLREWITTKDAAAVEEAFDQAVSVRNRWLAERILAEREKETDERAVPGTLGSFGRLFGLRPGPRKSKDIPGPPEEE